MGREKVHLYHGSKAILRLRRNVDMVQRKVLAGCTMDLAKLAVDLRLLGTKPMVRETEVAGCTMFL